MKFITPRDSATGKKFAEIVKKAKQATDAQKAFAKQYKISEWRQAYWSVWGGISAVAFKKGVKVDTTIWRNVNGSKDEWMPRKNTRMGKFIMAEIDALPIVRNNDLSACIGYKNMFNQIGFNASNKKYFGFSVLEKWKVKIPNDCEEVTTTKYNLLFKEEE